MSIVASAVHGFEEFAVRLGLLELRDEELDRIRRSHRVEDAAQDEGLLEILLIDEQVFLTGAGLEDVHRREDALVSDFPVENDFRVTGTFEFFEDNFIHPRTGVDECRRDDGERSTFLDVTSSTEEALRALQGVRVHTTGENLTGRGDDRVVGATEAGDGVQKDHNIALMLNQALGLLDDHFGNSNVARGGFVESGRNHLAFHRTLHVRHFFRAFIDEKNDQIAFRMIGFDGMCDVLEQNGFTRARRGDDQGTLAFTDRGNKIDNAGRAILDGRILDFHFRR